ncbi:MAG: CRTAC1 family protein [Planctomycetota bacterium]|jgi:Tfp pilus assembly protein PilF
MRSSLLIALLLLAACGDKEEKIDKKAAARAAMERGTGLLEAFQYVEAKNELRKAVELDPTWIDAKVNYAIALMNATSDEKSGASLADEAIAMARAVQTAEPDNPYANFLLGFLLFRQGEAEQALELFEKIPEPDAGVHFWSGQAKLQQKDFAGALQSFRAAIEIDRHCASAYYGSFICLSALGKREEADQVRKQFELYRTPQLANLIDAKAYNQIGRYVLAVRRYPKEAAAERTFEWKSTPFGDVMGARAAVGLGDVDGDGDLDVYLPGALYRNDGGLQLLREFPALPGLLFDFDNDSVLDLFLYGDGRDRLYRGKGDGDFQEVALPEGDHESHFALAADLDMDGDVDLFVTDRKGADRFLRNDDRKGKFTTVPIGTPDASRGAITADFDRDLDPDLIVARAEGGPRRYRNDRSDGFVEVGPGPQGPGPGLVAADMDQDGFEEVRAVQHPVLHADVDLDGVLDEVALPDALSAAIADLDGDGMPEIVAIRKDGKAVVRKAVVEKPGHWVAFDLRGRTAPAPPQWAAPVGPGSRVEILSGGRWQLRVARSVSGVRQQHSPWVHFGLGEHSKVDIVRILWPDRVYVDTAEGTRFVTDFLGVGGLGFFLAPGEYGKPDPDEVVWIGPVEPTEGEYVLRVLDVLEEITYLDEATLLVVDHPESVEVFPNERFSCVEPFPEFRIWEIEGRVLPVRARNHRGEDVLGQVTAIDRRYPPMELDGRFEGYAKEHALEVDFTGRVPALQEGERLILQLDGWVEYGYSHSNFAAWQAGVALSPPRLDLREGDGWRTAIPVAGYPAGLPRPMTLDVTGVVSGEHPVFRLVTNLEIFWDRVSLGVDRKGTKATVRRLAPKSAHLHELGYPREYSPDGRKPLLYDYALIDPSYPFRIMTGDYTRFGEVSPLLGEADDRYVIFGKGEEVTLRYEAPPPAVARGRTLMLYAAGWCKDMDGYTAHPETVGPLPFLGMSNYPYKEGEHYPDDEAHRRYRAEWNTRRVHPR